MSRTRRFRNLVFTLNNYTGEEYQSLLNHPMFKYVIIGKEVGEQGTPHLQGYAELIKQMTLTKVKKDIHPGMHFERRYGSQKEAIDYCKEDGQREERGQVNRPGERTDLNKVKDLIKSGLSKRELFDNYELNSAQLRLIDQ